MKHYDGETLTICYKGNKITKAGTVKIPVFLIGNLSEKTNDTISIQVKTE